VRRAQSILGAIIAIAFLVYRGYEMTLDTSSGWTVQMNQELFLGLATVAIVGGVWWTLAWTRNGRAAARRLRREHPGSRIVVVRGDEYLLGCIAQLRPDIADPMKLGRWQALAILDDRFELWGGREGKEMLLGVPWRFVKSVTVDDVKEFTYAPMTTGVRIELAGAEITPLRFALHMRGVAIHYDMSLEATGHIISMMNSLRSREHEVGTDEAVTGTAAP
jgi:hypothetical protein